MLDKKEDVGWPSQLEQVNRLLQENIYRIKVQQISGAAPVSVEIDARKSLHELKMAVAESLQLKYESGIRISLVLNENMLKDEFNSENQRWKSLTEYGIIQGATIVAVKQTASCCGMLNIVLRRLPEGDHVPMQVPAKWNLLDLEQKLLARGGLGDTCIQRKPVFAISSSTRFDLLTDPRKTLAEYNITDGTTLVWRLARSVYDGKENIAVGLAVNFQYSSTDWPLDASSSVTQQDECSQKRIVAPMTPTRRIRDTSDQAFSACKETKSREAKAKKMLKRL